MRIELSPLRMGEVHPSRAHSRCRGAPRRRPPVRGRWRGAVRRDLPSLHRALSVVLGFQAFWLDDVDVTTSSYDEQYSRHEYEIVDRYDTSRGGPPPPAPYAGTYDGPGYLIGNRPDSRAAVTTSRTGWTVRNRVELELESDMYQWTLGPRLTVPSTRASPFLRTRSSRSRT